MISLLCVFALCLSFSNSSPPLNPHQLELRQHYEHLAYIADFPCHWPQPKVMPVHKLMTSSQTHGKAYFPDVTVLFRCDECTGACTSGHVCAAYVKDTVRLPFKVTYLEDIGIHKKGSWNMEYHELLNHTQCACVPLPPPEVCHSNHQESEKQYKSPSYQSSESVGYRSSYSSAQPNEQFVRVFPATSTTESTWTADDIDPNSYISSGK